MEPMEDEQGHGDAPVAVDDEGGGDASAGEP